MSDREKQHPDSGKGARRCLAEMSNLEGVEDGATRPDPQVRGVWLVETDDWRAVVYLAGYPDPFGREREMNDFKVEWREER